MIEEVYCSFEVAKLLKEKGFNWNCITYYVDFEPDDVKYSMLFENNDDWEERCYSAPTHQMVIKWLREIYYLWIDIDPLTHYKWTWSIWFMNDPNLKMGESSQVISTYEETVEAAIKYCLKNLI